jgi:endonuclease YncB( thermonuclease family)
MVFVDGRDAGLQLVKAFLAWAYEYCLPEASPEIQAQYYRYGDRGTCFPTGSLAGQ